MTCQADLSESSQYSVLNNKNVLWWNQLAIANHHTVAKLHSKTRLKIVTVWTGKAIVPMGKKYYGNICPFELSELIQKIQKN